MPSFLIIFTLLFSVLLSNFAIAQSPPTITFEPDAFGVITVDEVDKKLEAHFNNGVLAGTPPWLGTNTNRTDEAFIAAFGPGTTTIGESAFMLCSKMELTSLPVGITTIAVQAFDRCTNLKLTSLPTGVVGRIGNSAFRGCTNLKLTSLPAGIDAFDSDVFQNCTNLKLTSLPTGITTISYRVFDGCIGLQYFTLSAEITTIQEGAFRNCVNLSSIIILSIEPPELGFYSDGPDNTYGAFDNIHPNCKLYVPNLAALDNYKNDADWYGYFGDRIFVISDDIDIVIPPDVDNEFFDDDKQEVTETDPMTNKFKVSFKNLLDKDKNTKFRVIYEIKNSKGRTIYKNETITSKAELEAQGEDYLEKEFHLRASGNGQGTIILTIKDMKGKVLSSQSKTFTVVNIPPRIISVKKKK